MPEEWAFVALGSNLGDSPRIVREAFDALQVLTDAPLLCSSLWRSEPIECPPGSPGFINAVAGLRPRSNETPESLLARLQHLEKQFGRRPKTILNEPRPLDLDLLTFGARQTSTPILALPHPRAHLRRFVLAPWNEIAPHFILPGLGDTVSDLLARLGLDQTIEKLK